MKKHLYPLAVLAGAAFLAASWCWSLEAAETPGTARPVILSIQIEQTDVVVTVDVPPGVRQVTLEGRARFGAGAWTPRAVQHTDGAGGVITFRLARSAQVEVLRIRAEDRGALPASFYGGPADFEGPQQATDPTINRNLVPSGVPGEFGGDAAAGGGNSRAVVESDIWVIRGTTVYFFNQYRGLQIIDVSNPAEPVVRGELAVPASGEQMYVLDEAHALLLARNGCGWGVDEGSQVLVVATDGVAPQVVGRTSLPGYIMESRLVGQVLYVAAQTYRKIVVPPGPDGREGGEQWEWGSQISSIDLADPTAPVLRGTIWHSGYGNVISATDRFLFVATQSPENWAQSVVQVIDIASPDGTMNALSTLRPAGRVADKFKLNLATYENRGDVFMVVSETSNTQGGLRASVLETFSLANPRTPQKLGQIEVGHGEGLYATRFDGDRAYIVTFLRIDPLWVVDLSDPAQPRLFGELQVPGWSTFIQPLGDRLVTIGIDNSNSWRVAVSLFDVRDPAKPGLLSKVPLGDQNSWSEANWDEKAFTVLPEAGLVLVPYQGWSSEGYASRVQLIDLGAETLTARGVIEHRLQPRRATVVGQHIVSISGREVLVVDAADRDHPEVVAATDLSWGVNRVLLAGDYLLEITDGTGWGELAEASIRVATRTEPNRAAARQVLGSSWPVLGAAVNAGRLFVLQGAAADQITPPATPPPNLRLTVFDLAQLPVLNQVGATEARTESTGWLPNFKPFWLQPGVVVWASEQSSYPWMWMRGMDVAIAPGGLWGGDARWWPWWGWGMTGRFLTFQWTETKPPELVSDLDLSQGGSWWNASAAHASGNLIYLSHQEGRFVPDKPALDPVGDPGKEGDPVVPPPPGHWETLYYLDVVDFTDPRNPTVRPPANLPGRLAGIAIGGSLLYTEGLHYDEKGGSDGTEYLDALAYDGVKASLITSLKLPAEWPRATQVQAGAILLARPESGGTGGFLESWALATSGPEAGQFVRKTQIKLASPANSLAAFGQLLAAPRGSEIDLLDLSDPFAPTFLRSGAMNGCVGWDLTHADGSLGAGLWVPLQDYGVAGVPLPR